MALTGVTDVEIERALNALNVTLNDQRLERLDLGRLQRIVTLALGGEERLRLVGDADHAGRAAWVKDLDEENVARVELAAGPRWIVERHAAARSGGYVPSSG